jgi:hypothetical protein
MSYSESPAELQIAIAEFWSELEWENAAEIARLESGWSAFAVGDTRDNDHPCGAILRTVDGVGVSAELSIGYFQINACNLPPDWNPWHLFNARHNAGTAHKLWADAGERWSPWYFSAKQLGLL